MVVWALFRANIFVRVLFRGLFWATFAWALFGALFGEGFRDFRDYETFMKICSGEDQDDPNELDNDDKEKEDNDNKDDDDTMMRMTVGLLMKWWWHNVT